MLQKELAKRLKARYDTKMDGSRNHKRLNRNEGAKQ